MCPYCGHQLVRPLSDGMSSCVNCCRVFDSSRKNFLLATAWLVRRKHINDPDFLTNNYHVPEDDAKFVIQYVADGCYSHEEFLALINQLDNCRNAS
jgi:hypothetical protein